MTVTDSFLEVVSVVMMWWIRQHLTLMLCLSVVALLRTTPMFQGHAVSWPALKSTSSTIKSHFKATPMKGTAVQQKASASAITAKMAASTTPTLNSLTRQYQYIFSGRVSCPEMDCSNTVIQMNMQTPNNSIERTVPVAIDGSYEFKVSLHELPHGQVDWTLMAQRDQLQTKEVSSRQILVDDQVVMVERELAF
jgi:hypothetical protein